MSSRYLPDNCNWTDLDKEQTQQVLEEYDLSSMQREDARVNFKENKCKIKVCDNITINDDPFYLLTCNPENSYGHKITKLLLKAEQRHKLSQLNPYSKYNIRASPNSILEPITPKAGSRRYRNRTRNMGNYKSKHKTKQKQIKRNHTQKRNRKR